MRIYTIAFMWIALLLANGVKVLTLAPEEATVIKNVVKKFLSNVHECNVGKIDVDEMKKDKEKITVHGSYQIRKSRLPRSRSVTFRMELDNEHHLLSYVRERMT